jgi:hypothetical protein
MNLISKRQRETRNKETLGERMFRFARKAKGLSLPSLRKGTPEGEEWRRGASKELYNTEFLKSTWERLRSKVIDEEAAQEADLVYDPSQIQKSGVEYLNLQRKTLKRRVAELREELRKDREFYRTWQGALDEMEEAVSRGRDPERDINEVRDTVQGARIEVLESREVLSLFGFRLSVVEAMLTQVAVLDYVMTWKEIFGGEAEEHFKEDLEKHEIRTFLIGEALHEHEQEEGELPAFDNVDEFVEWVSKIPKLREYEGGDRSKGTIRGAIVEARCWMLDTRGSNTSKLSKTLRNCVKYYQKHQVGG